MNAPTSASTEEESYLRRRHQRWHQAIVSRNFHLLLVLIEDALLSPDWDGTHGNYFGVNLPPESCEEGLRSILGQLRTREDVLDRIQSMLTVQERGGIGGECKEVKVNE